MQDVAEIKTELPEVKKNVEDATAIGTEALAKAESALTQASEVKDSNEENAQQIVSLVNRVDAIEAGGGGTTPDLSALTERISTVEEEQAEQGGKISDLENTQSEHTTDIAGLKTDVQELKDAPAPEVDITGAEISDYWGINNNGKVGNNLVEALNILTDGVVKPNTFPSTFNSWTYLVATVYLTNSSNENAGSFSIAIRYGQIYLVNINISDLGYGASIGIHSYSCNKIRFYKNFFTATTRYIRCKIAYAIAAIAESNYFSVNVCAYTPVNGSGVLYTRIPVSIIYTTLCNPDPDFGSETYIEKTLTMASAQFELSRGFIDTYGTCVGSIYLGCFD